MAFIYDLTDTWNAGGVIFNAIRMNVTDTASAAASRLVSLQVGGSERFSVDKAGNVLIGNGGDLLISSATGGNNSVLYNEAQDLYIATNGSTRMYISSSGNVGVGNVSPGTKLDVTGNIRLSASTPTIELNLGGPLLYSPAANTFAVGTGGGIGSPVERMRITSAGNVGIGTNSPNVALEVNGNIHVSGTARSILNRSNSSLRLGANNTEYVFIQGNGDLRFFQNDTTDPGFNNTTVGAGLGANGRLALSRTSNALFVNRNASDGSSVSFRREGTEVGTISVTTTATSYNTSANSGLTGVDATTVALRTNNTERMRITSGGNVGIGTSNPATRLSVNAASGSTQIADFTNTSAGSTLYGIVASIESGGNNTNSFHFAGVTQTVALYYLFGNGTTSYTSDIRVKKNVETTRDGYLEDVSKLRVVKYNWYNDEDDTPRELGFIAQEVEQVFPGLVQDALHPTKDGVCHKVLKASVLVPILTKALQEANSKIDALEARMTALETSASTITFQGN